MAAPSRASPDSRSASVETPPYPLRAPLEMHCRPPEGLSAWGVGSFRVFFPSWSPTRYDGRDPRTRSNSVRLNKPRRSPPTMHPLEFCRPCSFRGRGRRCRFARIVPSASIGDKAWNRLVLLRNEIKKCITVMRHLLCHSCWCPN
jgi:hypothetical protein